MLQEHHHLGQNGVQRGARIGMQQMGPPPHPRAQQMLMSLQPPGPPPHHSGVIVSMPSGPALISNTSMPQQIPKANNAQVYHYDGSQLQEEVVHHHHHHQHHNQQNGPNPNTLSAPLPNGSTSTLANIKEKTPMCLVNELARYNKIQHQYQLTEETGPAHKKVFTVTLKLGNEEYKSEGPSIKKAQHSAAAQSLAKTEFKHPPSKTSQSNSNHTNNGAGVTSNSGNIIRANNRVTHPTVELNALAMKRGEKAIYIVDGPIHGYQRPPPYHHSRQVYPGGGGGGMQQQNPNHQLRFDHHRSIRAPPLAFGGYHHHQHDNRYYGHYRQGGGAAMSQGETFAVRLKVGDKEYPGVGHTIQAARHDAAAKAIEDIKNLGPGDAHRGGGANTSASASSDHADNGHASSSPTVNGVKSAGGGLTAGDANAELKSPISLVHEIALKRNLSVCFDVLSEKGPPHMKVFVTQCRVGNLVAEGEGNGKKVSKKRAAENMLADLSKLPPIPNAVTNIVHLKRKRVTNKKKTRNLIKINNTDKTSECTEEINPISRLIQIQQANKEREPTYTVLEERGAPRRREFVIEASVNGHSCTGVGPNKKVAKRNAAEALLNQLGYATSPPAAATAKATATVADGKHEQTNNGDKARKVTFVEDKSDCPAGTAGAGGATANLATSIGGSGGRQLVPGILYVNDHSSNPQNKPPKSAESAAPVVDSNKSTTISQGLRSKDQLMYLAQLMNIQIQFSDFPKANHEMYLTLVSLSTNPPQVCHGEGPTTEASHEKAALEALKVLSELGLDIVSPSNDTKETAGSQGNASSKQNGVLKK